MKESVIEWNNAYYNWKDDCFLYSCDNLIFECTDYFEQIHKIIISSLELKDQLIMTF